MFLSSSMLGPHTPLPEPPSVPAALLWLPFPTTVATSLELIDWLYPLPPAPLPLFPPRPLVPMALHALTYSREGCLLLAWVAVRMHAHALAQHHAERSARLGALLAFQPDGQGTVDWLASALDARLEVAGFVALFRRAYISPDSTLLSVAVHAGLIRASPAERGYWMGLLHPPGWVFPPLGMQYLDAAAERQREVAQAAQPPWSTHLQITPAPVHYGAASHQFLGAVHPEAVQAAVPMHQAAQFARVAHGATVGSQNPQGQGDQPVTPKSEPGIKTEPLVKLEWSDEKPVVKTEPGTPLVALPTPEVSPAVKQGLITSPELSPAIKQEPISPTPGAW